MSETGIVNITDKLKYIPKEFALPKTTNEDYLQQAVSVILTIVQDILKTLTFLSYGNVMQSAISHICV